MFFKGQQPSGSYGPPQQSGGSGFGKYHSIYMLYVYMLYMDQQNIESTCRILFILAPPSGSYGPPSQQSSGSGFGKYFLTR